MAKVNKDYGVIQFKDEDDKIVTTPISGLTFVKDGSKNWAFYGLKGRSLLSDTEFADAHDAIGLTLPDDDDDLTTD